MAKRIIAIVGDFYHDEDLAKQSLSKAMDGLNQISVEFTNVQDLVNSLKTKPDAVILFAENRLNPQDEEIQTWMNSTAENAISDYVKNGGTWIAWHSGLASYENFKEYTSLLKGYFEHHPQKHQMVTYFADRDTDLFKVEEKFTILDEHYFVFCDEANTNVFLRSESVDGSSIAGWEHSHGLGKVICITPAHNAEGLLHPGMTSLLHNAIKLI
ncbi:ThuA domain-containing protein [Bacillus sp. FJAT-49711]|uniref:ThuA domain-containing protein n=1 Tax=Bacillus sp. FJAT-49711 TaxID=2833585 RepID=UPI001BC9EF08|nr:ThuA domain-containing protein [Bacillus sp. FJAT-49711]MBS4218355.1 ThuA domain-containing protein [Bacillus sp. FJAT-49711]